MSAHLYDDNGRFLGWCPTHNGVKVLSWPESGADEGCQHEYCVGLRKLEFRTPVFGIVPGGFADTIDHHRKNEKALHEYAAARKAGLQPESTRPGSVQKLEREIESQKRAIKKLEAAGSDTSGLDVHKGVRD